MQDLVTEKRTEISLLGDGLYKFPISMGSTLALRLQRNENEKRHIQFLQQWYERLGRVTFFGFIYYVFPFV